MDELEFLKIEFPKTEFISDSNKSVFENSTGLSEIFVLFLFLFSTSDFSFGFTLGTVAAVLFFYSGFFLALFFSLHPLFCNTL